MLNTKCPKGVNANPGSISHHSSVMFERSMYLFGGNQKNGEENNTIYCLDVDKLIWSIKKTVSVT